MKSITQAIKFLRKQKSLLIFLLGALNQTAFAQDTGYWDDRLRLQNYDGPVSAIAVKDSNIFIERGNSAIMWNGNQWDDDPPAIVNREVIALAIIGNHLYVGGKFTTVGNTYPLGPDTISANNIAKWNFVTKSWLALENNGNNGVNGTVWTLVVNGNDLYIGGEFSTAGGIPVNNIAKINTSTGTWMPLGEGVNGQVREIAVNEGELYVGGSFTSAGGVPANNIAKWDGKKWFALGSGVNHVVNAIAILDGDVYVGGFFIKAGDVNANCIAKWSTISKSWSTLDSGIRNGVSNSGGIANIYAIATNGRAIYVGGTFNMAGDQNANNIAKWDPVTNTWSPLGSGVQGQVFALVAHGNEVYVGGGFIFAGGKRSDRFAIWHEPTQPDNQAPVWRKLPDVTFQEDKKAKLNLNKFVSDANDSVAALTFSAEVINASTPGIQNGKYYSSPAASPNALHITIDPSSHIATFSANKDSFGIFTVVITATDPRNLSDMDTIQVTVTPVNDPPILAAVPSLRFDEDKSLIYPLRNWYPFVTDKDHADSTLTFAIQSGKNVQATRQANSYIFSAPLNWFGRDTLQLIVTDPGKLADTTALMITVNPINDTPKITGLPDSLTFKKGGSAQLKLWDYVEDVETPDRQLAYTFSTSTTSLRRSFDYTTGVLVLKAPEFHGRAQLFINVSDTKASAQDTAAVRVELPTSVASREPSLPTAFQLWPNSPNPFNPGTTIRFDTPHAGRVKLAVYTLRGELVQTLVDGEMAPGAHQAHFDGRDLASGIYFYRMEAGAYTMTRKMLLQK